MRITVTVPDAYAAVIRAELRQREYDGASRQVANVLRHAILGLLAREWQQQSEETRWAMFFKPPGRAAPAFIDGYRLGEPKPFITTDDWHTAEGDQQ